MSSRVKTLSIDWPPNHQIVIRKATQDDVSDVWRWRNDRVARANSLDARKISIEEHKTWFLNQLKNEEVKLFIAMKDQAKIGVVRFDFLLNNTIEVSININPQFRGKGFGKRILEATSDYIQKCYQGRAQKAVIKTSNVASEQIFRSAGFVKVFDVEDPGYSVWIKNKVKLRPLRILFFGNNWLGWKVADWLYRQNEEIVGLVLHPPEKRKFGNEIIKSVKGNRRMPIFDGSQLKQARTLRSLKKLKPDMGVSVFFGYILDPDFLKLFKVGCVNMHTAFLPFNRGAHPNVWSIVDDTMAGATIHYMDENVDTGPIIAREQLVVTPTDTGASLYRKLEHLAFQLFKQVWPLIRSGYAPGVPQKKRAGSYHMLRDLKHIDKIDLNRAYEAKELINILRARTFPPHPGAYYEHKGRKVYLRLQLLNEEELTNEKANGTHVQN